MSAEAVQAALLTAATAHRPTSGMQVSSGVTCVCGYWTGSEPQGPIPGGWNQLLPHMMREAAAAARPAIEREAKAATLRGFATAWRVELLMARDAGALSGPDHRMLAVAADMAEKSADRIEREGQA